MAKIIKILGWYEENKVQLIYQNTDHITTITSKDGYRSINIESYNSKIYSLSIYTKLSFDEIVALVNT